MSGRCRPVVLFLSFLCAAWPAASWSPDLVLLQPSFCTLSFPLLALFFSAGFLFLSSCCRPDGSIAACRRGAMAACARDKPCGLVWHLVRRRHPASAKTAVPQHGHRTSQPLTSSSMRKPGPPITMAHQFQPARDSANGTTQCAHCGSTFHNYYGLRRHVENNACKSDEHRGVGDHVPKYWSWVQQLCQVAAPRTGHNIHDFKRSCNNTKAFAHCQEDGEHRLCDTLQWMSHNSVWLLVDAPQTPSKPQSL